MKIKPINKLSDAELVASISSKEETKTNPIAHVGFFISHYNIRKGNYLVGIQLLYRLFKHWSPIYIPFAKFKSELKQHFLIYKKDYVHISIDSIKVTKETMNFVAKEEVALPEKYMQRIDAFIEYYGLESGTYWVESTLLYKLATFHCQLFNKGQQLLVTTNEFINYLKLYFPYEYTTKHLFRITEVNYAILKKEEERCKQWKEEQKSKNTVRRSKARIKLKNTV